MEENEIILPGDREYYETLLTLPPDRESFATRTCGEFSTVMDYETGLLRYVTFNELDEYLNGGEYDLVMEDNEQLD